MRGLLRLVGQDDKPRVKPWIAIASGRSKLLRSLEHGTGLDDRFSHEPPRGERANESLLRKMRGFGAPKSRYVISSDGRLDDTFCDLEDVLTVELGNFTNGTIISAIPGKLAFFRSAYPHRHFIVHRPD